MSTTETKAEGRDKRVLGVLGGMGPLASAEFLRTIYECGLGEREQESPVVLLYSDPTMPDRTEALVGGDHEALLRGLTESLARMFEFGVSKAVICCVTAHHLLGMLPEHQRRRVVSLLDVVFAHLAGSGERRLLVCTTGARRLRVFESHPAWEALQRYVVLPDEADQAVIHGEILYGIKKNRELGQITGLLESLLAKYEVESFIAGCTELHLVAKRLAAAGDYQGRPGCLDPLTLLARRIVKEGI